MKTTLMNIRRRGFSGSVSAFWILVAFLAIALSTPATAEEDNTYSTTAGSGENYQTIIDRVTHGELNEEDLRQVTVLSSRVLLHLNEATRLLIDDKPEAARTQIELARSLSGIVRDILPVTIVHTRVKDKNGKTVYDYTEDVQDDRISIYEQTTIVEVVQPVIEMRKDNAALEGLTLQDADFIYTSALLDLGYVERKLDRALQLIDDREAALQQLMLAQSQGLELSINQEDSPLVKAQAALQLAERLVGENKVNGAKANMRLAQLYLESYESLLGDQDTTAVENLRKQLEELNGTLDGEGMSTKEARDDSRGAIQELWRSVTGWMSNDTGQPEATENAAEADESNESQSPDGEESADDGKAE